MQAVRSALLNVDGVKEADVRLEGRQATVIYDPARVKVEDLIQAIATAELGGNHRFAARVKS